MTTDSPDLAISEQVETCDNCGAPQLVWRKYTQLCTNCGQIKRCSADLAG